jgi:hypothetical protein
VPVPVSLTAGTYRVTASYSGSTNFAGSSGTGQLVVAASGTGSGSVPGRGSSGGSTSGNGGTNGGGGSGIDVAGYYYSPQQIAAETAAGVALQKEWALQALYQDGLTQIAVNELENGLRKLQDGSSGAGLSSGTGFAGANSSSTGARSGSSKDGDSRGTRSGDGATGSGNGSSSNPTTVNLVANQSKPTSPAMTAWLLGLLLLAFVVAAVVAMRRNARRARALVASAGDDEVGA